MARAGGFSTNVPSTASHHHSQKHSTFSKSRATTGPKVLMIHTTSSRSTPANVPMNCPLCKNPHSIRKCKMFLNKNPTERFQTAKTYNLCINCLGSGHSSSNCSSKYKCQTCQKSYNTLLHFESTSNV